MRPGHLIISALVLLSVCYFLWRFGGSRDHPRQLGEPDPPPVILISIDTLRADVLGCYGSQAQATPRLDAFARDAILFTRAFTPEPQTLPAHTSLLTGLYPATHGVLPTPANRRPLAADVPTLAGVLGAAGYRTGAFVNVGWLSPQFGLGTRFDTYDYYPNGRENPANPATRFGRDAGQTNDTALEWLEHGKGKPAFVFLHYFDVHSDTDLLPYDSPESDRRRFAPGLSMDASGRNLFSDGEVTASSFLVHVNQHQVTLSERQAKLLRRLYLAGVAYTDSRLGELLDELRRRDIYDRSLIVVVADHGEELLDHGKTMHTQLHDECVHVPLMIKLPASARGGTRVEGLVGLIDVLPTIAAYLGLEAPPDLDGINLWPLVEGHGPGRDEMLLSYDLSGFLGLRTPEIKLITHARFDAGALFDLRADPDEHHDLARVRSEEVERLRSHVLERIGSLGHRWSNERVRLDEAQERALDALGYTNHKKGTGK